MPAPATTSRLQLYSSYLRYKNYEYSTALQRDLIYAIFYIQIYFSTSTFRFLLKVKVVQSVISKTKLFVHFEENWAILRTIVVDPK